MEKHLDELLSIIELPKQYISDYCNDLRKQINSYYSCVNHTDSARNKEWISLIKRINEFENECIKNVKSEKDSNHCSIENILQQLIESTESVILLQVLNDLIENLRKNLFQNQTIIYIEKINCNNEELFKGYNHQKNYNRLIIIQNFYITRNQIELIKNFGLENKALRNDKIILYQFQKKLRFMNKQIVEITLNESNSLDLSSNKIASIAFGTFVELENLEKLNLSSNNLTSIVPGVFRGLSNLQELTISFNKITCVEAHTFKGLVNLKILKLTHNKINAIEPNAFQDLTNLEELSLICNKIKRIDEHTFTGLDKLKILFICSNDYLSLDSSTFKDLKNLRMLSLADCEIDNIKLDPFFKLDNLKDLNITISLKKCVCCPYS